MREGLLADTAPGARNNRLNPILSAHKNARHLTMPSISYKSNRLLDSCQSCFVVRFLSNFGNELGVDNLAVFIQRNHSASQKTLHGAICLKYTEVFAE